MHVFLLFAFLALALRAALAPAPPPSGKCRRSKA